MLTIPVTNLVENWNGILDTVIKEKPIFIQHKSNHIILGSKDLLLDILSAYYFSAVKYIEDDGSITLSLNELDLIENAESEDLAIKFLAKSIKEYAVEYYEYFSNYSNAANRKEHTPYILKALLLDDISKIEKSIVCYS